MSLVLLCFFLVSAASTRGAAFIKIKEIKIRGYVTAINSPTSFEIEDYRITKDEKVELEFENQSKEIPFRIEDVRIGTELEIKGDFDEEKRELKAKKIKIDLEQSRILSRRQFLAAFREASRFREVDPIGAHQLRQLSISGLGRDGKDGGRGISKYKRNLLGMVGAVGRLWGSMIEVVHVRLALALL